MSDDPVKPVEPEIEEPKFKSQYDRGRECGERLIGTCSSIEAEKEDGDNYGSVEYCQGIDEVAFECNECGWWCEAGDCNPGDDGDICSDCIPDPED